MKESDTTLRGVGGGNIKTIGMTTIKLSLGNHTIETECYILESISQGVDMLIGDPALRKLTGDQELRVKYDSRKARATIGEIVAEEKELMETIEDFDMILRRYRSNNKFFWEYEWKWKNGPPPQNINKVASIYWKKFDRNLVSEVVQEWAERSLEPCERPKFCIPINPVAQDKPGHPIRVTGDFVEFNKHIISASTEESNEVCSKAIREIRAYKDGVFLDLSKAYQSVTLKPSLRDYNSFRIGNEWYQSKQMLFGISIGQKVLYRVLSRILENKSINFRDDIFIPNEEDKQEIIKTLELNGFSIKEGSLWHLKDLTEEPKRILGLQVSRVEGKLVWQRPKFETTEVATARDLARVLGQIGSSHLPCIGKSRAEIAILRSLLGTYIGGDHQKWNDPIPENLSELWNMTHTGLEQQALEWVIPSNPEKFVLYTDASKFLAAGIIRAVTREEDNYRETDDLIDLCKIHYEPHINIRELDAVIWGLQALEEIAPKGSNVEIVTDSTACESWVTTAITDGIIRTKAMYRSLIKARVDIIKETLKINRWHTSIKWVESKKNPADALTRVPTRFREIWKEFHREEEDDSDEINEPPSNVIGLIENANLEQQVRYQHRLRLHPGESAMVHIMKELNHHDPGLLSIVKKVTSSCTVCRMKRPPNTYVNLKTNEPQPTKPWEWTQIDTLSVSHIPNVKVMVLIDEYSRFVEYKILSGPPKGDDTLSLLEHWYARYRPKRWNIRMDRGREFWNTVVSKWVRDHDGVTHYSTVRRPTACGMVERVNRSLLSIMRIAKHEFPDKQIGDIIRTSIHEYWNRPHKSLKGLRPNQVLLGSGTPDQSVTATSDSEFPSEDEYDSSDSESEEVNRTPEIPDPETENFQTPLPSPTQERVLVYDPPTEKLDLPWIEADVLKRKGTVTVVRPKEPGRHVATVNQRWIQTLDTPTEQPLNQNESGATEVNQEEVNHTNQPTAQGNETNNVVLRRSQRLINRATAKDAASKSSACKP